MELARLPDELARRGVIVDPAALPRLERLRDLVLAANQRTSLTRIVDPAEFAEKHLLDALLGLVAGPDAASAATFVDIGSGAGFPGLPVAIVRPAWTVVLVESVAKKAKVLDELARALDLSNVTVLAARAEDVGRTERRGACDRVALRAVGAVAECLEYALPLLRLGGAVVLYRGPAGAAEEDAAAAAAAPLLGGGPPRAIELELPTAGPRRLIVVEKVSPTPDAYPRRAGVPAKRPLV